MDTPQVPQPPAPNNSKLWKVILLVAGGLTSFGIVSAALLSNQTDHPQIQNTQPIIQEPSASSKQDVQEAIITSTNSNIHQTEWLVQAATPPTVVPEPVAESAPAQQSSQTVQPTQQPPATAPNGTYTNTYGNEVPSPYAAPSKPAGASAQCNDGTYSFSQSRRGTCSGHNGVATWY